MSLIRRLLKREPSTRPKRPLFFFNTLGKEKQEFTMPKSANTVRMYNCGPTVYDVSHIGNLRSYVFADTIRRTLEYNGFEVKQVINITDFGHLSSDADDGKDKMSTALKREGKPLTLENMLALGEKYAGIFVEDLQALNIDTSRIEFPRASAYVAAEIAMVRTLEEKGYAYAAEEGVYFDTERFPDYGKLGDIDIKGLKEGARVAVSSDKRSPTDFLLWKSDGKLGWDSPWSKGFPGWHIECSAMINSTLGKQIDIHTGGIDLMPTHHNNEIAQSECATGKHPLSRFWLHHEFLNLKDEKISKSLGNMINLSDIVERDIHPLAYRYFLLGAHYRSSINFSWEALEASQTAFLKLRRNVDTMRDVVAGVAPENYRARWHERLNDDLDTPGALAVLWEMLSDKDSFSAEEIKAGILDIDQVLGLGLDKPDTKAEALTSKLFGVLVEEDAAPQRIQTLLNAREAARQAKDWHRADALRKEIESLGYSIEDTASGAKLFRR